MNNPTDDDGINNMFPTAYVVFEAIVALMAVVGNAVVLLAFVRDRRLRKLTNYYIVSLAVADFLVGLLGIPFAVLTRLGLPSNDYYGCLFMLSVLVILCTISIFNLVAVSIDRFWAILFPIYYTRMMSRKGARRIIIICWILGTVVGLFPVMGWHEKESNHARCLFTKYMDYSYLVFLYFATICFPSVLMGGFYLRIYCVVVKQRQEILPVSSTFRSDSASDYRRIRERKNDVNAAKILFIIVIFFIFCWIPLYTINCVQAFCKSCQMPLVLLDITIVLSHINSAGNPILYAYHLKEFRDTMRRLFVCSLVAPPTAYMSHASQQLNIAEQELSRALVVTNNSTRNNHA